MNETFEQAQLTQILFEISMSIGTSVELRAMLKPSLSTILKKLNCVSGGVYQTELYHKGDYQFQAAYTIPRRPESNTTYKEALALLPDALKETEANAFLATLPLVGQSEDGNFYHILELPGYGLLILIKNKEALADPIIKSLNQLLTKLAAAAIACVNEAKLRQSEERYRMFTNATFDGIMVHDGPIVTEINQALAETISYTPEELIGTNIFDFLDPSCHELARNNAIELTETPYELLALRKDGTRLPVEVTDRDYTENGKTYRVTAVRDLSHQKQLETELQSLVERRTRQVQISTQVAQAIAEATNLEDLYQRIVTEIKEQFGYYHTQLLRYDPEINAVKLIAGYGEIGTQMLANKHQILLRQGIIGIAASTGESVLRTDLSDDPDWSPNPLLPDTKGEIAVPIKLADEILGVLDVQSDTPDALTHNDQLLLDGLCGQIAVAINTTRLTTERQKTEEALQKSQQTLQETLEQQHTLHDVNLELSSIQDMDELYKQIIIKARERLGFDRFGLFLVNLDTEELNGTYGISPDGELVSIKHDKFNFSDGNWVKRIVYSEERIFVREDADLLEGQEVVGRGWHLTATMKIRGKLIGVIFADNMVSKQPFQPYLPELLSAYCTDAANLINRLRSEQSRRDSEQTMQEFLEKQQELHDIGIDLSSIEDPTELYRKAIELGCEKLGFERLGLYIVDQNQEIVHGTFGIGADGKLRNEYDEVHVLADEPWMHRFLYEKERLVVNDDVDLYEDGKIVGHGWSITTALWVQNTPLGLLFSDNLLSQEPLKPYQPDLLLAYGATIANLVDRARAEVERERLLKSSEEQAENLTQVAADLQTVADLSTQITSVQDPQKLLEIVVQETQARFGLYHCHIFLIDEAGKNLRIQACGWHSDAPQYGTHDDAVIPLNSKQSLVAQAARTRQTVVINDVQNDPNWLPNELLPDTRSEMAVPMIVGDTLLGVLDVQSTEIDRFDSSDMKIQATLAAQISVALENVRSLERSKEVVAELDALTRRLTRESWEGYVTDLEKDEMELVYSFGELAPVNQAGISESEMETAVSSTNGHHSHSLMVHGESIGQLTIFNEAETEQLDSDTALIIAAIAEQLSARVENIRLTDQTQQALAQTQNQAQRLGLLNEISAAMSDVDTLDQVFEVVFMRISDLLNTDRVSLAMVRPDGESVEILRYQGEENDTPIGTIIPLAGSPLGQAVQENRIIINIASDAASVIKSSMVAPISSAGRAIGTLNIGSKQLDAFTDRDENLLQQLATMLSSVVENKQLLAAAQARAERERQVRTITDRIRRGVDREAILTIAQKEISQLIGAKQSVAQLGTKAQLLERIQHSIEQTKQGSD